jgi:hypothetical protein
MLYRLDEVEKKVEALEYAIKNAGIYLNTLAQLLIDHEVCTPEDIVEMLEEKTEIRPED